ncbi:hypothetical protein EJB05_05393, partial [Eragrostis curvula]
MLHLLPPPGSPPFLLPIRIARIVPPAGLDPLRRDQICCLYLRVVFCSLPGSELPPVAASFPYLVVVLFSHLIRMQMVESMPIERFGHPYWIICLEGMKETKQFSVVSASVKTNMKTVIELLMGVA